MWEIDGCRPDEQGQPPDDAFRGSGPDHRRLLVGINRAKHDTIGLERDRLVDGLGATRHRRPAIDQMEVPTQELGHLPEKSKIDNWRKHP